MPIGGYVRMLLMKLTRTLLFWLVCAAGPCAPALAALGGDAASVEADRASMKAALRVTPTAGFTVHELQVPGGMVIREYASLEGKVFALTWRGPGVPDLQKMLGSYYEQFAQAASSPHYNHHHLSVRTPDVVVESSGHTRAFFGRAWAPALLPQNFSLSDIN